MYIKQLFLAKGRLRTGWRLLVFFVVSFPPLYYLTIIFWEGLLIRYIIIFVILLILSLLAARYLDKRASATVGYMFHSRWLKEYLLGVFLGFMLIAIIFFFELSCGFIKAEIKVISLALLKNIFILSLVTRIFQTAFEELFFRGYLYQNLIEGTNVFIATAFLSILFGAGHLLTPSATWIVGINLTVFGVMHALGYLRTRSLWFSSGLHFGWNFFGDRIFSLAVSGTQSVNTILTVKQKGPSWITGGQYGPEAGVPALFLMIAACLFIYYWKRIRITPEMEKLWNQYR